MKKLIHKLVFGKNGKLSGLIALAVIGSIALGCNCGKNFDLANLAKNSNLSNSSSDSTSDSVPSNSVVEGLVKDTISQFSDAVDSGDFADLRSNASTDFQSTYSVSEMKTAFKSYTDKRSLVVPVLNKVPSTDANFSRPPSLRSEKGLKILVAEGKFPTKPYNVRFEFEYVMRGGEWKLLKLVVNIP
ncbi:MAG: hypothetical protein ACKVQJ_04425 [Pyrinomonadaceae bacterium]